MFSISIAAIGASTANDINLSNGNALANISTDDSDVLHPASGDSFRLSLWVEIGRGVGGWGFNILQPGSAYLLGREVLCMCGGQPAIGIYAHVCPCRLLLPLLPSPPPPLSRKEMHGPYVRKKD